MPSLYQDNSTPIEISVPTALWGSLTTGIYITRVNSPTCSHHESQTQSQHLSLTCRMMPDQHGIGAIGMQQQLHISHAASFDVPLINHQLTFEKQETFSVMDCTVQCHHLNLKSTLKSSCNKCEIHDKFRSMILTTVARPDQQPEI